MESLGTRLYCSGPLPLNDVFVEGVRSESRGYSMAAAGREFQSKFKDNEERTGTGTEENAKSFY